MSNQKIENFGLGEIGQIAVPVSDIDRAISFYRDILGMNFLFKAPLQGLAFLIVMGFACCWTLPSKNRKKIIVP